MLLSPQIALGGPEVNGDAARSMTEIMIAALFLLFQKDVLLTIWSYRMTNHPLVVNSVRQIM